MLFKVEQSLAIALEGLWGHLQGGAFAFYLSFVRPISSSSMGNMPCDIILVSGARADVGDGLNQILLAVSRKSLISVHGGPHYLAVHRLKAGALACLQRRVWLPRVTM